MALKFTLKRHNVPNNPAYGKWYARTLRGGEMHLDEIEQRIQSNCSATRADVRAVLTALSDVVTEGLKDGKTVDLGELGKLSLSIRSESVAQPDDFRVDRHVKGVVCCYTPAGRRRQSDGRIIRPFTDNIRVEQATVFNEDGHVAKRIRRGGNVRK